MCRSYPTWAGYRALHEVHPDTGRSETASRYRPTGKASAPGCPRPSVIPSLFRANLATMIDLSPQIEALAQRLADAQSVTVQDAIRQALEARARAAGIVPEPSRPRDRSPEAVAARRVRIDQIVREIAAMPILDRRSPREITDHLNAYQAIKRTQSSTGSTQSFAE